MDQEPGHVDVSEAERPSTRQLTASQANRIVAGVLFVFGLIVVKASFGYGLTYEGGPGPGLFPLLITIPMTALSAVWLVMGPKVDPPPQEEDLAEFGQDEEISRASEDLKAAMEEEGAIDGRRGWSRIAFAVLWSVVTTAMIEPLGMIIALTVYVTGLLVVIARVGFARSLVSTAVGVLLTAWGCQTLGVALPDPLGILQLMGL
jgi:Tripartite tricarboxylate transporter TctB family